MNNEILEAFCRVIDSNSKLKVIKNHSSSEVWAQRQSLSIMKHSVNCSTMKLFDFCNTKPVENVVEEQQKTGLFACVGDVTLPGTGACAAII